MRRFIVEVAGEYTLEELQLVLTGVPTLNITECSIAPAEFVQAARERIGRHWDGDEVEIDEPANMSEGEEGVWIQAWVHVPGMGSQYVDPDADEPTTDQGTIRGYTHYFRQNKPATPEQWKCITEGFRKLHVASVLTEAFPIRREYDDAGAPEITDDHIIFNGIGEDGYETMVLVREGSGGQFCKTGRMPYDRAVMALLILADHCAPGCWRISSDGDTEDWQPTLDWMNSLEPSSNFKLPTGVRKR